MKNDSFYNSIRYKEKQARITKKLKEEILKTIREI